MLHSFSVFQTSDLQKNPFSDFPDISEYEKQPGQGYIRIPEKPDPPEKKWRRRDNLKMS